MLRRTALPLIVLASIHAAPLAHAQPACSTDWNGDGTLDCADLRAYLRDYFIDAPQADFNNSGQVSTQDLFDWLGAASAPQAPCQPLVITGSFMGTWNEVPIGFDPQAGPFTHTFTIGTCTDTDGPPEPASFSAANPQIHDDHWFAFTQDPFGDGTLTIDTCFPQTTFDTRIAVYYSVSGVFPPWQLVGSADDNSALACSGGRARLTVNTIGGVSYLVRVGGASPSPQGAACRVRFSWTSQPVICPPAGPSVTQNFQIDGAGNGTPWSWAILTPNSVISDNDTGVITATAAAMAQRFVNDINTASANAGCAASLSAVVGTNGRFSITATGGDAPDLYVGPSPGFPTCRVNVPLMSALSPCTFNPSISAVPSHDCNGNSIDDALDVIAGTSTDYDRDGVPDECTCAGDYNRNGAKSPQDIFDFLADYFAHAARGDFNNDSTHSVQDIFDFLAAYFSACL